jgi:hypothetical protein
VWRISRQLCSPIIDKKRISKRTRMVPMGKRENEDSSAKIKLINLNMFSK